MPEAFKANVQYNDFTGSIAIDGHEGGFLDELAANANIPVSYWPVGFEMWNAIPQEDGSIPLRIVAASMEKVGHSIDEMTNYARTHGELPVRRFESRIEFSRLLSLMKRLDIKVRATSLEDVNVVVYGSNDS